MKILKKSQKTLEKAVSILKKGGVVICPTDTLYGFLADAQNKKAVEKIFRIKKRPKSKPLPVFVKNLKMVEELTNIDKRSAKILKKFWPGKYTFILKRKNIDPYKLYGVSGDTIAIRIPKYKFLNDLLRKINRPLVQTSVNISTQKPLNKARDTLSVFGKNRLVSLIINAGDAKKAKPSSIVDLTSNYWARIR